MTFKHKLSARLALLRNVAIVGAAAAILACEMGNQAVAPDQSGFVSAQSAAPADTIFAEDFESGTLNAWQDGVDPTRQKVVTDASGSQSGSRYLDVTYPAGADGGWLTRFFMPGYDSLYVSYWVRFPTNWLGSTKLLALYGSRTDNQWSAFGQPRADAVLQLLSGDGARGGRRHLLRPVRRRTGDVRIAGDEHRRVASGRILGEAQHGRSGRRGPDVLDRRRAAGQLGGPELPEQLHPAPQFRPVDVQHRCGAPDAAHLRGQPRGQQPHAGTGRVDRARRQRGGRAGLDERHGRADRAARGHAQGRARERPQRPSDHVDEQCARGRDGRCERSGDGARRRRGDDHRDE